MKTPRQEQILKIIAGREIETQHQLMAALRESGAGHLQILLDFGAEGIVRSEGAYNAAPLDPAVAA